MQGRVSSRKKKQCFLVNSADLQSHRKGAKASGFPSLAYTNPWCLWSQTASIHVSIKDNIYTPVNQSTYWRRPRLRLDQALSAHLTPLVYIRRDLERYFCFIKYPPPNFRFFDNSCGIGISSIIGYRQSK